MSDQIRASDWCAAHREWSPCPDCETADTIARLTRERDAARAEAEEAAAAYNAARRDLATETATRAALRTQESRILGILADAGVEVGDVVRGVEALAARARWSRLWHAEARRLWREVQALSEEIAQERVERLVIQLSDPDAPYAEVDPREFARQLGGCPTCGLPVHPEHDACRLSRGGAR